MCIHHWLISTPSYMGHIIGVCKYCHAQKDFTILQQEDKGYRQICLADTLTRPDVTLNRIVAEGNGRSKKPRGRQSNYSRGRVK